MKLTRQRTILLALFVIAVLAGFGYLVARDEKIAFIQHDIDKVESRFSAGESVDIAMAMKLITSDPPKMEAVAQHSPPLLLFPPTAEELRRLSGD